MLPQQPDCSDARDRKFSPCTDVSHWQQLLGDAGFSEVSVVKSALHPSSCLQSPPI